MADIQKDSDGAVIELALQAIDKMRALGADASDVLISSTASQDVSCRMGKIEDVERAESRDIGLRAIIDGKGGKGQAFVSGTGARAQDLDALAERVVAMARAAPINPYCGLAERGALAANSDAGGLDLYDAYMPTMAEMQDMARRVEDTARARKGITNSEGAAMGWGTAQTVLATSDGFAAGYRGSHFSLGCAVIGGTGADMERDYASHGTRHFADLDAPEALGDLAATRTVQRLNPRKIESRKACVFFDPRVSGSLLRHLAQAISGTAFARGTSFLRDALDTQIMPAGVSVYDDPTRARGLGSVGFDGEGLAVAPLALVANGVLENRLLDTATAKQLETQSNGRASRGIGSPPVPSSTNLYMEAGTQSPQELMRAIGEGLLVTELIGMGVNGVTGL